MNRNSEELARRIDVMVTYQNGEAIQYRNTGTSKWLNLREGGTLSFNWERCNFRVKPKLREGYVFASQLHQHPGKFPRKTKEDTCFRVREVTDE